ncbi:MAG: DUF2157 domain-containing protein [Actinomycetes bacterium]
MNGAGDLDRRLQEWVGDGLLTADQAERISAHEDGRHPPAPRHDSLVGEALSYVGAVLVLVAAGALSLRLWDDLSPAARAALVGAAAAVLLLAGTVAGRSADAAAQRMRGGLWVLSTVAFAGTLAVLSADAWSLDETDVVLVTTLGTLPFAAALWAAGRALPQHVVLFVTLLGAVGAGTTRVVGDHTAVIGAALWLTSVVWWVLAARSTRLQTRAGGVLAALGLLYGSMALAASGRWGTPLRWRPLCSCWRSPSGCETSSSSGSARSASWFCCHAPCTRSGRTR